MLQHIQNYILLNCQWALIDDKHMKRAGLDYIKDLDMQIYENWEEFVTKIQVIIISFYTLF